MSELTLVQAPGRDDLDDLSRWSTAAFDRLGCAEVVERGLIRRKRSGLGGSHTVVTYPPLDALQPIESDEVREHLGPVRDLHLYAHVAFCEVMCPFCHYATTYTPLDSRNPVVEEYMDALEREVAFWRREISQSRVKSIYVGGGTPTALSSGRLTRLIAMLREFGPHAADLELCIETSPITVAADDGGQKLLAAIDAGVNRISIGVQTFDSALSRRARGHLVDTAAKALKAVMSLGVKVNVDLLQDLPDQTDESLVNDLAWIREFLPDQVTWYLLRLRPESAWYPMFRRGDLSLPTDQESARRRLLIREGMKRLGYLPKPGGRFVRDHETLDSFKSTRSDSSRTLLGMGVSAYSHGWGFFFRNTGGSSRKNAAGIPQYLRRVREEGCAIETGLRLSEVELAANSIVSGIRQGCGVPKETALNTRYLEKAMATLGRLEAGGLLRQEDGAFMLTELGSLFEEEICALFYTPWIEERLKKTANGSRLPVL